MLSFECYRRDLDYSYAPGLFPSLECMTKRPELARRLLIAGKGQDSDGVKKLTALAEEKRIRIEMADKALSRISGKENCFAAAVFTKFRDTLRNDLRHVVLHHPGDSGNIGTILRTALGFGMEDIALIRPCADVFDPRTVRASMGSLFRLRLHVYDSFEEYRAEFPERPLYPFMLDASVPLGEIREIPSACSLIFGNEGSGLPGEFAALGQPVRIESSDKVDSLNLAVAAGIGIYYFSGRGKGA